jgi:ADYC domain-containing protein
VLRVRRLTASVVVFSSAVVLPWLWPAAAQQSAVTIEASGTGFRVTLPDGSVKQGMELAGAVLTFNIDGKPVRVRIASITPDANRKGVLLHDFRIEGMDTPLCSPDPDGKRLGFPLAGRSDPDGRFLETDPGVFELVCTSGAQGKCVRFGYHPWETTADGTPMREHYNACVRMVRADYCGDGRSWTRDGTIIDMWDDLGIQKPDTFSDPGFSFEAGWKADGAVCVARTRIPENITLDGLKAICPNLATLPTCNEASARAAGALLFNRSR